MMSLGEVLRRIRYLLARGRYTRELEEEIRFHLELRAASLRNRGWTQGDALIEARRRFGNVTHFQERSRDMWGMNWLAHASADVRFAVRRLLSRPGFSVATITIAALGIGATTAVFSAVDAALLRPLPFFRPSELVTMTGVIIPFGEEKDESTAKRRFPEIGDLWAMPDVFSSAAAYAAGGLNLADPDQPRRLKVGVVTTSFFSTLGVAPQVGRAFTADEGRPGGAKAVVISDGLWRTYFGAADIEGRTLALSGGTYAVVGVMPAGFSFPRESDAWIPLPVPTTRETFAPFRGYLPSYVIARVAPGVSIAAASRRALTRWEQLAGPPVEGKRTNLDDRIDEARRIGAAVPLRRDLVGDQRKALLVLMAATTLLLLIVCANIANLLLSDAASRRREVALREVLGASRGRIVRQLLVESLVLAACGAAAGLMLAPAALKILRAMMPANLAGVAPMQLDLRVLAFATGVALVTGIVFGTWPALGTSRVDPAEAIKSGGGHGATAGRLGFTRRALIVAEVALTMVLLVGSGLMLRSFELVLSRDLGMSPDRVGTLDISFARTVSRAERLANVHAILDQLGRDQAIDAAGVVNDLPLSGQGGIGLMVELPGAAKGGFARYLMASGDYFKALSIPLLKGRTFTTADDSLSPPVAIISKTMAEKWWPNADPIGRTFLAPVDSIPITVVGVVADVLERSLTGEPAAQMYFPIDKQSSQNIAVVARSSLPPSVLLSRLTDAVRAVDRSQAVYNVRMMDAVIGTAVAPRKTNTLLITIFGAIAMVLSAFGIYAVVSYSVTRRMREFGIRTALGASGGNLARLVGGEMAWVVSVGLGLGLAAAWLLTRVVSSLLYGIDAHDATTFAWAPVVLIVPAAIATLVPARRATRVSPVEVIRAE
jgi:predicted permease